MLSNAYLVHKDMRVFSGLSYLIEQLFHKIKHDRMRIVLLFIGSTASGYYRIMLVQ